MSWHDPQPTTATRTGRTASISICRRAERETYRRLQVVIGKHVAAESGLKEGDRVRVQVGKNADRGMLLLSPFDGAGRGYRLHDHGCGSLMLVLPVSLCGSSRHQSSVRLLWKVLSGRLILYNLPPWVGAQ